MAVTDPVGVGTRSALSAAPHTRADAAVERARLRVVVATILMNLAVVALLTLAPGLEWRSGQALALADVAVLGAFALIRRDGLIARLMVFGLAVGLAELAADAWLVDATRTLDYAIGGGPQLWRSPIWMPLAWGVVAVQTGYLGTRLIERFGAPGLLLIGLLGAVYIPYYEELARRIHWWTYGASHMLSNTPNFIVLGEFGIAVVLALVARPLRHRGFGWATAAGLLGGAGILACYALAFLVFEGAVPT